MPINHTDSFFLTGDTARSVASAQSPDQELKYYINFSTSGQAIIPASGDTFPNMNKLMGFGMYFPGVGTNVTVKTWSSGGYLSGLAQATLTFNSGYQGLSWLASGPSPVAPLTVGSGAISAISAVNNYLASGQLSSGVIVLTFNN